MDQRTVETIAGTTARGFLAVACILVTMSWATTAWAESGSVRYSYEQVEIGDTAQWVLVPRAAEKLSGEVTNETIRTAFQLLRSKKGTSYGDTSIEISGGSPERATVTVQIDPDYSKYKLIIMAETVYTLTELGVDDIRFPGFAEGSVGRKDIPFSAYTVSMPLWRALPPGKMVDARIRLPDGAVLGFDEVKRRWQQNDPELQKALYQYLDDEQTYTVVSVLKMLPDLEVAYAGEVIPLLDHDTKSIRSNALKALAARRNQNEVLSAVLELMEREKDKALAERAAEFLGEADDPTFAIQKQFFYLKRGKTKQRISAAEKLADAEGDDRAVERLGTALRADNDDVASAATDSLLALNAHQTLIQALGDDEVAGSVRMQAAEGLSKKSDAAAQVAGYRYLGNHADGRAARVAVRSLGDIETSEARKAIESFLTDEKRRIRLAAAETLEKRGAVESLGALADAVRNGNSAAKLEGTGVRILENKPLSAILDKTSSSDTVVQRMAYRALGSKAADGQGGDEVFETLKTGAGHSDPSIRGAAARALGAYANDRALKVLKGLTDDGSAEVRRDVAHALGHYDSSVLPDKLVSYLDDDNPEVVAAALESLAERGQDDKWDKIRELSSADQAIVRENAMRAMAKLVPKDDDKAIRQVISRLSGAITSDKSTAVVRTAVRQLGKFERDRAVNGIAIKLNSSDKDMRLTAIESLADTGHSNAVDLLTDLLGDSDADIRRAVIVGLGELGDPKAISALQQRVSEEKNGELKRLIKETIDKL